MKGVILAPILAAILADLLSGSPVVAAAAFFVVLALAALGIGGEFLSNMKKPPRR